MKILGWKLLSPKVQAEQHRSITNQLEYLDKSGEPINYDARGVVNYYLNNFTVPAIFAALTMLSEALNRGRWEVVETRNHNKPIEDHPALLTLNNPSTIYDAAQFWGMVYWNYLRKGNAYCEISRVSRQNYLFPVEVTPEEVRQADQNRTVLRYTRKGGGTIAPADLLAFHGPGFDGLCSPSPVESILRYVIEQFGLYDNETNITLRRGLDRTVLQIDPKLYLGLAEDEREAYIKRLSEAIYDIKNRTKLKFLAAGVELVTLDGRSASDIDFTTPQHRLLLEVCRVMNIPPRVLFLYSEGQRVEPKLITTASDFVNNSLQPRANRFGAQLTFKLLTRRDRERGYKIRLNLNNVALGTLAEAIAGWDQGVARAGIVYPNEARRELSEFVYLPPDPNGDRLLDPKGAPAQDTTSEPATDEE